MIKRLQGRFLGRLEIEPVIWEHEPLLATATFQDQIVLPSETDVVVCMLWARLGTRLPAHITRADGSRYDSGTEFEFEDAFRAFEETGSPEGRIAPEPRYRRRTLPRSPPDAPSFPAAVIPPSPHLPGMLGIALQTASTSETTWGTLSK